MIKRSKQPLLLFSVVISILFLGICSRSSPLYPMNDWEDVHCFFTVGRSITDGLVPYRDLYEQKGPVLYFLFALASLISRQSFIGVFFLEVITFALFLYFSGKIARLYLGDSPLVFGILALLAPAVTLSTAFANGSSAEQYCLWIIALSFYLIDRAIHESRLLRPLEAFFIGLCAGYALYIKFTILGFFLGLALFVLIWYLIYEKKPKALPAVIGAFLGGILAVSLPVFLYFAVNGAVGDFVTVYFYNNLFLYQGEAATFKERFVSYYVFMMSTLINNPEFTLIDIIGGIWLMVTPRKNHKFFTAFLLGILFLSIATLGGGRFYPYYTLTFSAFAVYGLIAIALLLRTALSRLSASGRFGAKTAAAGLTLLVAVLLCCSYRFSGNTYFMAYGKEDLPQFQFAEYIRQKEDPSLLYYGFLDGGFYYAADLTPPCKYFAWLNIPLEDVDDTQNQLIQTGAVDFVVTRNYELDPDLDPSGHYALAAYGEMPLEEEPEVYYLYEKTA